MAAGDTHKGDKVKLQPDDSFTIIHQGETLKFKLDPADRSIELVSVSGPGKLDQGVLVKTALLRKVTSPKISFQTSFLKKISRADTVIVANVTGGTEDLEVTLPSLSKFSKEMTLRGARKPVVLLQAAKKGTTALDLDKTIRTFRGPKHGLDAHAITMRSLRKKSEI